MPNSKYKILIDTIEKTNHKNHAKAKVILKQINSLVSALVHFYGFDDNIAFYDEANNTIDSRFEVYCEKENFHQPQPLDFTCDINLTALESDVGWNLFLDMFLDGNEFPLKGRENRIKKYFTCPFKAKINVDGQLYFYVLNQWSNNIDAVLDDFQTAIKSILAHSKDVHFFEK